MSERPSRPVAEGALSLDVLIARAVLKRLDYLTFTAAVEVATVVMDALKEAGFTLNKPERTPAQRHHNHLTREIRDRGLCPACDYWWEKAEEANDD